MRDFFERYMLWLSVAAGVLLLALMVLFVWWQAPPREFTIFTGREGGAYHAAALEYQKIAADKGFTLNVVPTAGSLEALDRLQAGEAELGFAQGGTASVSAQPDLTTAASVFFEPLWIFYRSEAFPDGPPTRLDELKGKRINLGENGSGTHVLATTLLEETNVPAGSYTLFELSSADAIAAMSEGEIDVGFFVVSPRSDLVRQLFAIPGATLMSLELAPAYAARHRYLSVLTLPKGTIDPAAVQPAVDISILTTVANVIARADIHPDLLRLMSVAMVQTHEQGGILEDLREFPSLEYAELPVNKIQLAFIERFKNGESMFDNYLPFWAASILDRYLLFVVPVVLIVLPVLSRSPLVYTGIVRMRIRKRYRIVRNIDERLHLLDVEEIDRELERIEELDQRLATELQLANQFMPEVFDLRGHLEMLEVKLRRRRDRLVAAQKAGGEVAVAEAMREETDALDAP